MTRKARADVLFLLALALLCVSGVATYLSFSYFRISERSVSHTQEVRAAVGDLEAAINYAARTRMSFVISGAEPELNEHEKAVSQIPVRMRHLQELTADNPVEVRNCAQLDSLTQSRLQAWDESIREKKAGKPVDVTGLLWQNVRFSEQTTAITDAIRAEEGILLQQRTSAAQHRFIVGGVTVVLSFFLALVLLYVHYRVLAGELHAREKAEEVARLAYARESLLRQEQGRFRLFVEAVKDYAIYMLDSEGRVASWNEGAKRIKGYEASEIIGKHFSCFFSEEDARAGKPQQELETAAEQGQFEGQAWRLRKDGSRFWADIVLTAIKDRGKLVGFSKVTRDFTERMRAQEGLRTANAELAAQVAERQSAQQKLATSERSLRELSLHLLRTQDEERRRIGRELHDSLGQYLAVLKMNLESLESIVGTNHGGAGSQLAECVRLADDSIKEMRTISYLLYPPMLEEVGLKSAILWYLEGFSKRSNIQTTFDIAPDFGRLGRDLELALFRVLQESLTNVHRHSGSSTAHIKLLIRDGQAVLEIEDQGKGIPAELFEDSGKDWLGSLGVGLRGMNERMRQLGGKLEVSSSAQGTVVAASIPVGEPVPSVG